MNILRAFVHLDKLQPQYAAVVGSLSPGTPPIQGMSGCMIEVQPSILVVTLADQILKGTNVTIGTQEMERSYGALSFHSLDQSNVREGEEIVLNYLGLNKFDRKQPRLNSKQIIHNVHPRQAQVINQNNIGGLLIAGKSLMVLECEPAGYISYIANECEKGADITLVRMEAIGAYGRLWVSGTESAVTAAEEIATKSIAYLRSTSRPEQ